MTNKIIPAVRVQQDFSISIPAKRLAAAEQKPALSVTVE
jgi:hypothetical protein